MNDTKKIANIKKMLETQLEARTVAANEREIGERAIFQFVRNYIDVLEGEDDR
jgi:hypothetical protein